MSGTIVPEVVDLGPGAARRMAAFCAARSGGTTVRGGSAGPAPIRLVADRNTWAAAGAEAEAELRAAGLPTRATIFEGPEPAPDARAVFRLLVDDDPAERLYVAVGSGTITDIVRFAAHRTGRDFVSLPTAPSVDAYSSVVAPMLIEGVKRSVGARSPIAIFADPAILAAAPRPMIAAGFGDMLAKLSADADWRLGELALGEDYDAGIAARSVAAARACVAVADSIGAAEESGVRVLVGALVESGTCMALAGNSRPASGAEHQYAHYWEMKLYREGRPPILHGLKSGFGTIEAARLWRAIASLPAGEARSRLASYEPPSREAELARIRESYGPEAEDVAAAHGRFLSMSSDELKRITRTLADAWERIAGIASAVPSPAEARDLLARAGCPVDAAALGLRAEEVALAYRDAHYLRERFTVAKLARALGIG
jgi:glycerol-1-phosphate dehydrogenase [NAD(P)+]